LKKSVPIARTPNQDAPVKSTKRKKKRAKV
jgi:hypothetical protein